MQTNQESGKRCTNFSPIEKPHCKQTHPAAVMYKVAVGYKLLMKEKKKKNRKQETGSADVSS